MGRGVGSRALVLLMECVSVVVRGCACVGEGRCGRDECGWGGGRQQDKPARLRHMAGPAPSTVHGTVAASATNCRGTRLLPSSMRAACMAMTHGGKNSSGETREITTGCIAGPSP